MKQIKKYTTFLGVFLLMMSGTMAQTPQHRTNSTIVADVLAQLPAQNPSQYNQLMKDLVSTGEEGFMNLIGRLNPPGNKSNETVDYAISGWIHFVANNDAQRAIAASVCGKALQQPLDDEIKAMLIRQLELIGDESNVAVLSTLLTNERLSGPASQALAHIGTPAAGEALLSALLAADSDQMKTTLVNALGQAGYLQAEPVMLELLNDNPSGDLEKVLYDALGKTGTKASLQPLKKAAEQEKYAYGKANPTAAYLSLLNRLAASEPGLVKKEAEKFLSEATKLERQDLKVAAAGLLLTLPSTDKVGLLKKALKDGNIVYLTQVLNSYPYQDDEKAVKLILKTLSPKASSDVQIAILYWIGNQKVTSAVSRIPDYLNTSNKAVQKAAVYALSETGGESALISLVGMLKSTDENAVKLAKEALEGYAGDISAALASVFNDCGNQGKIAILQLMANRRMHDQYRLVYDQLFADNETVKVEAAKTLRYVVAEENLPELFGLLEQTDDKYLSSIQQAVNAALSMLSPEEQMKQVMERMNASTKKYAYYAVLANSGTPQALDLMMKAYQTETGKNKQAAFDAIKQWKSFDAVYVLQDIARSSKDKEEIAQAVDAIIEKVASSNKTGAVKYLFLRNAMEMAQTVKQKNNILRLLGTTDMYQAMVFVAPYMDDPALSESAAQAAMNIALNNPSFAGTETTTILNKVSKTLNNPDADYQRQSIRKYLSENPTTGGFVSLFNGKDLEGWKGLVGNPITRAKMSKKELAAAQAKADSEAFNDWKVVDGTIVFDGKGFNNLCTVKQYGDFELLVDWKLFPGPEPDAGIYLRGTPQVQIWDTARVNVGARVGSGGLYNNRVNPSKPLKVADLKLGEWNTFRIRMIGDRVSVWLNGELVTDNVILENYWDRNLPIFPIEQIELQAHGSKVAYRDIYIKEFERPEPFRLSEEEEKEGFRVLFDGTNMHEWTGNTKDYVLEDGNIVMHPSKSFGGNLYTKDEFDNFVLRFEFMLTPGANNGLGIRTPMEGDAAYVGMEIQILDNEAPIYKDLQPYQYHGSVYGVIPAKRGYLKPTGEWNYQEVIADGDHIKVILNGTTILDGNIREAAKNGTMDHKDHPGLFNKKGHIGFLGHGSEVKFRNIRIKELKNQ